MEFAKLAQLYRELEQTSSGNKMREILAEFLKTVPKEDIGIVAYLTLGRLASEFEDVNLGIAEKSLLKSIAAAAGVEISKVKKIMEESGDAGLTAEKILQKKQRLLVQPGTLTIQELFEKLHKIAQTSGLGSQEQKAQIMISMLQKASPSEACYLVRIALGTLRMGVGDMTLLDALALAFTGEKKNKEYLERAYNICPDVKIIAETVTQSGIKGLEKIDVHVGRPIKMMLAQRVKDLSEVAEKMPGKVAVEGKYDGERIQAHKDKHHNIMLFSRRLENITSQFPDLVEYLQKNILAQEFVVEGEVLAIDKAGNPQPFQILMQRRRKYDVEEYVQKIPLQFKVFDLLYVDGQSYLKKHYTERTAKLEKMLKKSKNVVLADKIITDNPEEIETFFQKMLAAGYEGIMIKSLAADSVYQAGTRGWNWIKWKPEYVTEIHDTLDLVVVGAYHGKGKRSGVYGALLCAAYNKAEDRFETVCKLGTGLTDQVLAELPPLFQKYKVEKKPARVAVQKEMLPDLWFEPAIVVEVLGAEITKSPFHTAGVAVRFPRFIKFREDKNAEQATTTKEIKAMLS